MSDDFKQTMISAVFERRAIWDQRHAGHHNRFKLDKLWKEVARKCETSKFYFQYGNVYFYCTLFIKNSFIFIT